MNEEEDDKVEIQIEMQNNVGNEQLQNGPLEEVLKQNEVDRMQVLNEEVISMDNAPLDENFRRTWESTNIDIDESSGQHWSIFYVQ